MRLGVKHSMIIVVMLMGLFLLGISAANTGTVCAASKVDPGKVSSITLTVTGQPQAKLEWEKATGKANGYAIIRDGKTIIRISGSDVLSYVDESLTPGKSCTYKVQPYYKDGKGNMTYGKASPEKKVISGYSYKKENGAITLTGYTGRNETVTTPSKIENVNVGKIGDSCFRGNVWIKKVIVSSGVSAIENYAFEACSSVRGVSLPGTVKTIGDAAFSGCAQMKFCEIPDSVTSLGKGAFLYCTKLAFIDLPKNLNQMGEFAFAGCDKLSQVEFTGNRLKEIPDRAFCQCTKLPEITIPDGVETIGKRAFSGCESMESCRIESAGSVNIGDYAFERCYKLNLEADEAKLSLGFGVFSALMMGYPKGENKGLTLPDDTAFVEGTFYGSRISGIINVGGQWGETSFVNYTLEDGVLYSKDKTVLIAYFPTKMEYYQFVPSESAQAGELQVPDGVTTIAPYAFCGCDLTKIIMPESLQSIEPHAFTMSNVKKSMVEYDEETVTVAENAFDPELESENADDPGSGDGDDLDGGDGEGLGGGDGEGLDDGDGEGLGGSDGEGLGNGDTSDSVAPVETTSLAFKSLAEDSIFNEDKFHGYLDIHDDFSEWCEKYIEYNKENVPVTAEAMPYISMYTGEDHYRQMASALNGDAYKTQQSILRSGDDYKDMYLMIDHGLFAELSRGRMPGDLLLYSGITPERVSAIAGQETKASGKITGELRQKIIERIGAEFTDPAIMSTTASIDTAFNFSSGEYGSCTIVMIYGSKKALDYLGTICVDDFSTYSGEEETLFNADAGYRILDVGLATKIRYQLDANSGDVLSTEIDDQRTYVKLELLGGPEGDPQKVKDIKGAKVTLSASALPCSGNVRKPVVKKVVTSDGKTLKSGADYSVIWSNPSSKNVGTYTVTISGKGKYAGTVNAKYKISPKGTSLATLAKAKKAVTVKWKKQSAKMAKSRITGYQIRLATNSKYTKNKKTVTVKGYKKAAKTVKGLKGGKKYYVKIRTYKTVGGVKYYSPWSGTKTIKTGK